VLLIGDGEMILNDHYTLQYCTKYASFRAHHKSLWKSDQYRLPIDANNKKIIIAALSALIRVSSAEVISEMKRNSTWRAQTSTEIYY